MSGHLARVRTVPDPVALATIVGPALGATGCALTVAGVRHQWGSASGGWIEHTVSYDGQPQGRLAVSPSSAGPLAAVAALLGAPLAMARLAAETDRLRRAGDAAARELTDDRWQAVVEMEQERRGLERDLHDGAQHHLVALRMSLAIAEHSGAADDRVRCLLDKLDDAERVLLDTASGMLPVALESDGLVAALTAELADHDDVVLNTGDLHRRYPPVVESAAYFACLEAVSNAHKHAPGALITVTARDSYLGLEFVVSDGGPGFAATGSGTGLRNLPARIEAISGTVTVRSAPGRGTTITGFVPC